MDRRQVDSQLDLISQKDLIKNTEISCNINDPLIFLNQLRDHNLVPEEVYKTRTQEQRLFYNIPEF